MVCTKCGSTIPAGSTSCPYCNAAVDTSVIQSYGQPAIQPEQSTPFIRKNGMATTGLIFGILSTVFAVLPYSIKGMDDSTSGMLISVYFNLMILGIIFSAIGNSKSRIFGGKGKAITGLILSISSFLLFIVSIAMGS